MSQRESRHRTISVEVDGVEAQVRLLPASEKRCSFAVISGPGAKKLLTDLTNEDLTFPVDKAAAGLYIPKSPESDLFEELVFPHSGSNLREQIGLPEHCMVVPAPPANATRKERIEWGSTIHHEFVHSRGGGEYAAYRAEDNYRRRNGLAARFKDDDALFSFLRSDPLYGHDIEWYARIEAVCEMHNTQP